MPKHVYSFGGGSADGNAGMKNLLGGKGANLAEMTNIGLPVPAGFTITTEVCTHFYQNGRAYPEGLQEEVGQALRRVETAMGARFGDRHNPLLVSVRSGARVSMPGMMDTVLNLGLNDTTVQGLAASTHNPRFAWDAYRRFVQMFGDVVLGLKPTEKTERDPFEVVLEEKKAARGVALDTELAAEDLEALVREFKDLIRKRTGRPFPEDPTEQLWAAIGAVFGSWENERAVVYRRMNGIPVDWGTAVSVVAMVFGNMGTDSGTGVAFTRDPATGERVFYGEYLTNAQGEDVVAGIRTPKPIAALREEMPAVFGQLLDVQAKLEKHYRDMQDIEFTVQKGHLWMLQCRSGKRTGFAAVRVAVDMVEEGLITEDEALLRVEPESLNQLLRPIFDPAEKRRAVAAGRLLAKGLPAGPGAAAGRVVFHADDAEAWARRGETVLLVRIETSPEDIRGMNAAAGILTARGGMTSHAALVARQMGKVCVVGAQTLAMDYKTARIRVGGRTVAEGDWLSIDGSTGEVIQGRIPTLPSEVLRVILARRKPPRPPEAYQRYTRLLSWADRARRLEVWANADQPDQAATAIAFGAEGIGLCRTEHMFFGEGKIGPMREMIVAPDAGGRRKALAKLLPIQRKDYEGIFRAMGGRPVTIRTLDPPLHEFLPHEPAEVRRLAKALGVPAARLEAKIADLHEVNPMLGHRGCRLGIAFPEITEMQAQAIFEAACAVKKRGIEVRPDVMIPLVAYLPELKDQAQIVRRVAEEVMARAKVRIPYRVGTMIELPRAAVVADQIAREAEFFSFGTNDLTQTTLGLSRDDAGKFLPVYVEREIIPQDPFQTLDTEGVGALVRWAVERGRATRTDLKVGICGEHGGDPASVIFCHGAGLDYVSCSPYRIPIARLAAAQGALRARKADAPKAAAKA